MFGKHPSELSREDIGRIITEQVQEGAEVEFKEALPAREGNAPWVEGEDRIGDYARDKIIAEVIAFANAYGGTLVIGVRETEDKPARAAAITPVRACAELADRLRLQCRDCIDPQLPILEVEGVPIDDDGAGVVVFRVPHSRMAPHRHTVTKECYVRRADRTEKMMMREIQDLTLQVERGIAAIEATFVARQEKFAEKFASFSDGNPCAFGFRATLIPLTPLYIERVYNNEATYPPLHRLFGTVGQNALELFLPRLDGNWRPTLRGARASHEDDVITKVREIGCDGLTEYVILSRQDVERERQIVLYTSWLMCTFGNALCAVEKFRRAAGTPEVEYGLEFEIVTRGEEPPIGHYRGIRYGEMFGPFPSGKTIFPRYSIGPPDEFQEISALFERDFWHAAGHDWEAQIEIDFVRALRELGIGIGEDEAD